MSKIVLKTYTFDIFSIFLRGKNMCFFQPYYEWEIMRIYLNFPQSDPHDELPPLAGIL